MKRLVIYLLCGASMCPLSAMAAENDSDVKPNVEQRVSKLEKVLDKMPTVSGFVNMRYEYKDNANGFDIRRARLDFKGTLVKKLDYRLQIELANSPKILDAFIHYKFLSEIGIQAGEFKIPFSIENSYGPTDLETIDNSMAVTYLCNYSDLSGISANGRDVGVCLKGGVFKHNDFNYLTYAVGLFNGNGINVKDNNKSKDFSGTLTFRPVRDISIWGSYYNGCYGKEGDSHSRERAGGGLEWKDKKSVFRSEYIYGNTGGQKSEGVYALAGYYVHSKVQVLLKYDYFQQNKSVTDTRENDYLVGLNYSPLKCLKLQANYVYKSKRASKDVNYVAMQFFAKF